MNKVYRFCSERTRKENGRLRLRMFIREHWKWTRLLMVYVVALRSSSCNGIHTNKMIEVTSSSWLQTGEMETEVGTDGSVTEVDDSSAEFLAQHGQGNLVSRQLDAGGHTTEITDVGNSNQLHLVSGEEQGKGVAKRAPNGNPASKNEARIFAPRPDPTELEGLSYTTYLPGTGWPGTVGGKDAIQDDELLEGTATEDSTGPLTDNPPLSSTLIINEITTEHVSLMDSSLVEGQEEATFLPSARASTKPALNATPTEFSAFKSTERDTPRMRHIRSKYSTLQPATDETPFSELNGFEATTLRKTNEALISDASALSFDTEMTTLQTAAATDKTSTDDDISTYETSPSADPDLNYNNDEDSTERATLLSVSPHTTKQVSVFHTQKTVISATTTVAITPVTDQTTTFTASRNESNSTEPTKPLESNSGETLMLNTLTTPVAIGVVVVLLVILAGATLCFIQRRHKSRNFSYDNNEGFFITNNQEEEHLNATFEEKGKGIITGMYSETELVSIDPHDLQEKVFNAAVEEGKDGEKPKCLGSATTKADRVSDFL